MTQAASRAPPEVTAAWATPSPLVLLQGVSYKRLHFFKLIFFMASFLIPQAFLDKMIEYKLSLFVNFIGILATCSRNTID